MGMTGCLGDGDDSDTLLTLTTAPFTTFNNDDETTDNSGDGDGDSNGDGDSTGDGDGDSGDGDGDSGDGDGDSGDGDGDSTTGDGDSGDGDGDGDSTTGDGDASELCTPYASLIGECYGDQYIDAAYMSCADYYYSFQANPACFAAFEDFVVCLSSLSCVDFMAMEVCDAALMEYQANCG